MSGVVDGVRQLVQYVSPATLKRLRDAGAVDPKGPVALAATLPWLLGRGPSLGIVSRMNAIVLGDKPAIHDRRGTVTFRELDDRANRAANLFAHLGVAPGDGVGLLLRNGREMAELILGAQKSGVVACPFNTWAKPKELAATIEASEVSVLVYDAAHAEQVAAAAAGIETLYVGDAGAAVSGAASYEDALLGESTSAPSPFTRDRGSARIVIQTSGTTGKPKGAARNASASGVGAMANLLSVIPYRRDDVFLISAPLFHSFGLMSFMLATGLGATMVLPERFDPEGTLALIDEHRATAASLVPVMVRRVVGLPDDVRNRYDTSSMRVLLASGSAMSTDLRRAAARVFGNVIYDLYGSTEVGWVSIATPDDMARHPTTVGKVVPGIDVAVFSDDGERVARNEIGELFIHSDVLFEGYTSGESKKVIGDYMSIGDLVRMDDDGYLFVEGRADDMVVVGGENIYPIEIENVIEDVDGVDEVAVVGVPDPEFGEILAAFVVGSADPEHIKKVCESELASYKVPRRIEVVDELPRTSTGKVVKRALVERVGDGG